MSFSLTSSGSFNSTENYLKKMARGDAFRLLDRYGSMGVEALRSATHIDSSETANSWSYEVERKSGRYSIKWTNSHMAGGTPVVILLQYGHGTGTGGYVQGRDFINPAIKPIFDKIADEVWREVTRNG